MYLFYYYFAINSLTKFDIMLTEQEIQEVREYVFNNLADSGYDFNDDVVERMVKFITEDGYGCFFRMDKWVEIQEQKLYEGFGDDENMPTIDDDTIDEDEREEMNDALVKCCVDMWFKTLSKNI